MRPAPLLRGTLRNQIPKPVRAQLTFQTVATPTAREALLLHQKRKTPRIYARRRRATPDGIAAPASRRWHIRGSVCEEPYRVEYVKVVPAQLTLQIPTSPTSREPRRDIVSVSPRALAARRRSAIQRKRKVFPKREGKQPERVSPLSLVRLCLLSPHSESRFPPNRRKLKIEIDYTSPRAKIITRCAGES